MKQYIFVFWSTFLIALVALNFLLGSPWALNYILSKNPVNFFYIEHDTQLKHIRASRLEDDSTLLLGSSRTIYSLNPKGLEIDDVHNLGLMGGSQADILELLKLVEINKIKPKHIILEFNQSSLSDRQMSLNDFDPEVPFWLPSVYQLPFVRYRNLVGDSFSKALTQQNSHADEKLKKVNRMRRVEFFQIDENTYQGHLNVDLKFIEKLGIREHLTRSCHTMLQWSLDSKNLVQGKKHFLETLKLAKNISQKVTLYFPPLKNEYKTPQYSELLDWGKAIADKHHVQAFELTEFEDDHYFDCVHTNSKGAELATRELQKFLEVVI